METELPLMINIIPFEPMSYKQQIAVGVEQQLLTKLRIVRAVKREGKKRLVVAKQFQCHRNTVGLHLKRFTDNFDTELQQRLIWQDGWTQAELIEMLQPLKSGSRRPHHHSRQAVKEVTDRVVELFKEKKMRVGAKRLRTILRRRFFDSHDPVEHSLAGLKLGAMRGIYRREKLRIETVKTGNGQRRPLYDYSALACFEWMHYDTKHILDLKALPEDIYRTFANNSELPLYQWTLQDAKSRFRFLGYSRGLTAEFGLKFLVLVIQYLRTIFPGWQQHITVGMDNGVEFCSGSPIKQTHWNNILSVLDAQMYSYHPGHDIRKNLIERSHLSDDDELYVSRGKLMGTLSEFMREARGYAYYCNFERPHSGIAMKDRTPFEVIHQSGLCGTGQLMKFPIIVMEDEIETIRQMTDHVLFQAEWEEKQQMLPLGKQLDVKKFIDLSAKYDFFDYQNAQYLLTQHPFNFFFSCSYSVKNSTCF